MPAFGLVGPGFDPGGVGPLFSSGDALGRDGFSCPLGSILRFVHCVPSKSPLDLSCHKTDVKFKSNLTANLAHCIESLFY